MNENEVKEVDELLEGTIRKELENVSKSTPGSKEHTAAVNDLAVLYKLRTDENRARAENDIKRQELSDNEYAKEKDRQLKQEQADSDNKHRWIGYVAAAIQLVVPLAAYGIWMNKGFQFEKEGTYTSQTFRNFFGKFRPKK